MKNPTLILFVLILFASCKKDTVKDALYVSDSFSLYKDRVVQGDNTARVLSPTHITSNYRSPVSSTYSRLVKFKFSVNEKDNELPIGVDHWVVIGDEHESPLVTFGERPQPLPQEPGTYLPTNYDYTFRVDVSPVLRQFEEKGYYEAWDGTRVAESDFQGFFIAGGSEPLTWDWVNLKSQGLQLEPTSDPFIYSIRLRLNPYNPEDSEQKEWKLSRDISHKPQYTSAQPIVDALYNLSLEEALMNIEPDSTLRTGAKWGGVWTRDVSYSILLAFAYHEPEVAKISLRHKVKRGRIVQDTGSGGAWPISSDRTTWVLAAWEIYKVTGDRSWLNEVYPIIRNTLEDDAKTLFDPTTGLYRGESSFLDWREQTYPKWMDNRDIFVSQNLGTNVVHFQAHRILAEMARIMGEPADAYEDRAEQIKAGINRYLWLTDRGYYAQFLYGREHLMVSPRYEALGEALAVLFGVADSTRAASIIGQSPLTEFGATCIYPQIPGIPPYHNNGIWPFVQSYWNWAAARTGNEAVLNHGLASIYRAAGLFLTNYENMVAETGDFEGTEINSDRMLWSMAGNLAMVYRVFLGMEFGLDGLHFKPVIPKVYGGDRSMTGFRYRSAVINVTVKGHGTRIKSVTINGRPATRAFIPAEATGEQDVVIRMAGNDFPRRQIQQVDNHFSPATVQWDGQEPWLLQWKPVEGAKEYRVYRNGRLMDTTLATEYKVPEEGHASFMVSAVDAKGHEGFASEPLVMGAEELIVELEDYAGSAPYNFVNHTGRSFVELSLDVHRDLTIPVTVERDGDYLLDFRYANGHGRWNTDNKCAIRSLSVNDAYQGVIVMPQRGQDEWSNWGYTNAIRVSLKSGRNRIRVHFEDWNHNMNVDVNGAMLDHLRLFPLN